MNDFINSLSRRSKWVLFLLADNIVIICAFYAAFALRYGEYYPFSGKEKTWLMLPALMFFGSFIAIRLSIPKIKLHAFEVLDAQRIGMCSVLLALTAISLSYLFGFAAPRSVPIIFGVLFFVGAVAMRINGLFILTQLQNIGKTRMPVAIYGAGVTGIQLASALRQSSEVKPTIFVDDNKPLQNLIIAGLSVHAPSKLPELVKKKNIKRILVAMPSVPKSRQREIIQQLKPLPCEVQILPSYVDMITGNTIVEGLRPVTPEDLLGRDKLDMILPGVTKSYKNKAILVSGAGGSIGSELCRQALKFSPSKLVLYERSELALYLIEKELKPIAAKMGIQLIPVLGCVCDKYNIDIVFKKHDIQIVLHAAAYKHVPLVESNELAGLKNNVLGTQALAKKAIENQVERFVLISTDKAVRPTNIMGASKRLAELVVQDIEKRSHKTIFSMVRFGNVLGSSGSVIPLFHEQIAKGGPITLTHEDVTRYFMAITEAANLVLNACSLATGGEVFLLDMGESVKIRDLAQRMVELSGLTVQSADNPDGDIEIITTGLRPGEKLYEELLIDKNILVTSHPKIMRAKEKSLSELEIAKFLKDLRVAIKTNNVIAARKLVTRWVDGYHKPEIANDTYKLPTR